MFLLLKKQATRRLPNIPRPHRGRETQQFQGKALWGGFRPDILSWKKLVVTPFPQALFAFLSESCLSFSQLSVCSQFSTQLPKKSGTQLWYPSPLPGSGGPQARESKRDAGLLHPGAVCQGGHKHQSLGVIRKWRILYLL